MAAIPVHADDVVVVSETNASFTDRMSRLLSARVRRLERERDEWTNKIAGSPPLSRRTQAGRLGFHSTPADSEDESRTLSLTFDRPQDLTTIGLVPARVDSTIHADEDYGFPRRFRIEVSTDGVEFKIVTDETGQDVAPPVGYPYQVHGHWPAVRIVRITATKLWPIHDRWGWTLGEVMLLNGQRQVGGLATVDAKHSFEAPPVWSRDYVNDGRSILGLPVGREISPTSGYLARRDKNPAAEKWLQVDLCPEGGQPPAIDEVCLVPARPIDYADRAAYGFPPRFRVLASDESDFQTHDVIADHSGETFPSPGDNPVVLPVTPGLPRRFVRFEAVELWDCSWKCSFALAEIQVLSGDKNAALNKPVTVTDVIEPEQARGLWSPEFAVDGFSGHHRLLPPATWLKQLAERQVAEIEMARIERNLQRARNDTIAMVSMLALFTLAGLSGWIVLLWRRWNREQRELRERIAGDLHDDLGSNLGSIALTSGLLVQSGDLPESASEDLRRIKQIAGDTLHSLRDLVWLIDSPPCDLNAFRSRLSEAAASLLGEIEHEVTLDSPDSSGKLSIETRRHYYLAAKEILHNVSRHSHATKVAIRLRREGKKLRIEVHDNGRGFDRDREDGTGHGLRSLQRRAKSFGGTVTIETTPEQGTKVTLEGPLK
ncbi:ATP-binding protein [Crateriforma conspicua]|uniref:Oxygen sensor histidine kinase NreB n=1 Tax=Crateriforma conspicua TaxID=2527996 RepID=A0A5C6FSS3_9PLAN|nr:ATP-binding protein [Crateriforma conspicua]TWU64558.1 Sensor histidine kinase LiaS [Crateriforma conspicua]